MDRPPSHAKPAWIGARYEVLATLGRGGMAVVYRVRDALSGRELALKQLLPRRDAREEREAAALFEREFHTLTQLSHPRVIEVYDFGVEAGRAYYTMELLDGGDLRERCPVPWQDACRWLYDVCSSLALLHSRRLVHRDITPRNVRCTQSGAAKLIDFGALVPMGAGGRVIGTPGFVAPEVFHRSTVDGRADLYSLGATLYYALTGQPAYLAGEFSALAEAWRQKPPAPSSINAEIPPALDALVMSLLSLEPAQRPRTAFDVMQRLSALAGIADTEALSVSRAYLTTPVLVARQHALSLVQKRLERADSGQAGVVMIHAPAGLGRSRMLDAAVFEAKTLGANVLRARGSAAHAQPLSIAHALLEQAGFNGVQSNTEGALDAACGWLLELTRKQLLVIALDDVHEIDEPSCSLLAMLADRALQRRILFVLTAESSALPQATPALRLLLRDCMQLELPPLDAEHSAELLGSVFGDVPNIPLVSDRIFRIALGKPRETMELAQCLVDRGSVVYQGGSWVLPSQLDASELPDSAAQALAERVACLAPLARFIVESQSLAAHPAFTRDHYLVLCAGHSTLEVDAALDALLSQQVLLSDGKVYVLSHGSRGAALADHLDRAALLQRQRALAELYAQMPDQEVDLAAVHHLLAAELPERAIEQLMATLAAVDDERAGLFKLSDVNGAQLASVFERALTAAQTLGRPARERCELRRYLTTIGVVAEEGVYARSAPIWLAQLERDSGLQFYRQDAERQDSEQDPNTRLQRAFTHATEQYAATPENERGYAPADAIKFLVHYVVVSIAVGARTRNAELIGSLAAILEPFVALSPLIEAMWQNAIATWEVNCGCQAEQAHARVTALYARLEQVSGADLNNVRTIRNALAYCAGAIEAGMGRVSAMKWADVLDQDSLQLVNAMHIRKVVRLQQGDAEGSERFRRQAELLAARATFRQMFAGTAHTELGSYALARDLTGVKRALTEIEKLALRCPGWVSARYLGEGHLQRLRGNLEGACVAYQQCLALVTPDPADPWRSINAWPAAVAGYMQSLLELGRCEQAAACGEHALVLAKQREIGSATHEISRVLALAEARLGLHDRACARLNALIDAQLKLGISGLILGASYEARARIAIAAGDHDAVERYSVLTAEEYRHGHGSPLGALYERLIEDARKAGVRVLPQLSEFESRMMATGFTQRGSAAERATQVLRTARSSQERAERALGLICDLRAAAGGHLCLVNPSGLVLAASRGASPADAALLEHARKYVGEQLREQPEHTTQESGATTNLPQLEQLKDALGTKYQPVLLHCVVDGIALCAGVALVAVDAAQPRQSPLTPDLLASIGALLIQAGNTVGMRTTDC